jgi:hypothetical protein
MKTRSIKWTPVLGLVVSLLFVTIGSISVLASDTPASMDDVWAILFFGTCAMVFGFQIVRPGRIANTEAVWAPEKAVVVSFDDDIISARYANNEVRSVRWDRLSRVAIRTTDEGPFMPDVFWGFHEGDERPGLVYPQGATGDGEMLQEMQRRLKGLRNEVVIEAMGTATNAYFVIWEKDPSAPGQPDNEQVLKA